MDTDKISYPCPSVANFSFNPFEDNRCAVVVAAEPQVDAAVRQVGAAGGFDLVRQLVIERLHTQGAVQISTCTETPGV
jgi:hypothetical protein